MVASSQKLPTLEQVQAELARRGIVELLDTETAPEWFHAGQLEAWESDAKEVIAVAGTQGGKTALESHWLLREIQRCAPLIKEWGRGDFLYIGPTLNLLEAQAIPMFEALFVGEHGLGRLIKGSKPKFRFSEEGARRLIGVALPIVVHFAYANDSSNLESLTALAAVWDESGQKENKVASFEACNRRLTAAESRGFGRRFWGTTPYVWNWFKDKVHDPAEKGKPGYSLHRFVSWMNPVVDEEVCRKRLSDGMPLWEWEMMYLGLYTRPAGVIYDCVSRERHGIDRFPIPKSWPRILGLDFGPDNTAAIFLAAELTREKADGGIIWGEPTGRYVLYRSYKPGFSRSADQHVFTLRQNEPSILSAGGGARAEGGWRQAFAAAGLPIAEPPNLGVEPQIANVYRLFASGKILIFNDLTDVWDELRSYSREVDDEGNATEKIADKAKFHLMDALRYAMAHASPPRPVKITRVKPKAGSFA